MKKVTTTITKNNETTTIYAWVDDKTALMLEQVDEQTRREYIISEHEFYLNGVKESRRHVSYEECLEKGVQFSNEIVDYEELFISNEEKKKLFATLSVLSSSQRWLLKEIFCNGRTQKDIAAELGVSKVAIFDRLKRIFKKIKKIFELDP